MKDEKKQRDLRLPFVTTLSTVDSSTRPYTCPIEIIKIGQKYGIFLFTKNGTRTVEHLHSNPFVTLGVYLPKTHRQIFITGKVVDAPIGILEHTWKQMSRSKQSAFLNAEIFLRDRKSETLVPNTFLGYHLIPDQVFFYTNETGKVPEKEQFTLENNNCWSQQ